jgi:SAM-dependent methyltransferase
MPLEALRTDEGQCPACGTLYPQRDGIWRFLTPEREAFFKQFIAEYAIVRQAEGRGCDDPAYYRALPFVDLTGRFCDQWRIRARSFRTLAERVLPGLEAGRARPLRVLDLGAGNGWLSYRLSMRGHYVVAVDLLTNASDGLGAHVHYDAAITPVQAEFDRLPFGRGQADLAIFNAALHYSTQYETTLREALRALRGDGRLVILDSPVYRDPSSGEQMVREREAHFEQVYGFPSNALPSENYLTFERLHQLKAALGLRWEFFKPFYGWRWALKPWRARLRATREPAQFLLIVGRL